MKVGTKSVLFGAHCFLIHPIFVAIAWIKLYGFPFDPRIWVAFFVHDLGYWGKPNMDGPEGETHVELGAKIMHFLFDRYRWDIRPLPLYYPYMTAKRVKDTKWRDFSLYHSRYYAKKNGAMPSKLCFADKLSFNCTPRWLYLPMVNLTGEIKEYLKMANTESPNWNPVKGQIAWHNQLCEYMAKWVEEHKDGSVDTWTNGDRNKATESGVLI